ncbi:MAG: hypothetical protein LUH21_04550 [Clostridiales bacterium]|nr:hypothetical protein [Clostridiales bacterium]
MIFKIYLVISSVTFILYLLKDVSLTRLAKEKCNTGKNVNKDITGILFAYLKLLVISFIPIFNILFLIVILFMEDKLNKEANRIINEAIKNKL